MARIIFLFLIRGGGSDLLDIQLQNPPPPIRFKRLFSVFQCVTRDIVRNILHDDDRVLFKSPLSSTRRLESLGFNQSTPRLKFRFVCNPIKRKSLGVHLLQLRPSFSRNSTPLAALLSLVYPRGSAPQTPRVGTRGPWGCWSLGP